MGKVMARSVGRRKTSVAIVRIESGKGQILINKRTVDNYFPRVAHKQIIAQPLEAVGAASHFDITVSVRGGGSSGQAGAVRLGIARALEKVDSSNRQPLKQAGLLTRDAREVERKKYGQPGARKKFQFSKR